MEAVSTIIWVAPRLYSDVQELKIVSQLLLPFTLRYAMVIIHDMIDARHYHLITKAENLAMNLTDLRSGQHFPVLPIQNVASAFCCFKRITLLIVYFCFMYTVYIDHVRNQILTFGNMENISWSGFYFEKEIPIIFIAKSVSFFS